MFPVIHPRFANQFWTFFTFHFNLKSEPVFWGPPKQAPEIELVTLNLANSNYYLILTVVLNFRFVFVLKLLDVEDNFDWTLLSPMIDQIVGLNVLHPA